MTDDTHHPTDVEDRSDDQQQTIEACQHALDALDKSSAFFFGDSGGDVRDQFPSAIGTHFGDPPISKRSRACTMTVIRTAPTLTAQRGPPARAG